MKSYGWSLCITDKPGVGISVYLKGEKPGGGVTTKTMWIMFLKKRMKNTNFGVRKIKE